jgi:RNA polymerase sigma-70 factor (ECF subfamily)
LTSRETFPAPVPLLSRSLQSRDLLSHAPDLRDDLSLLALVRRGDEAALAALYDRYAKIVYSVALRVLHHSTSAEDVLQELFLEIWRSTERFLSVRGSFGAWLALSARNRAMDALRRRRSAETIADLTLASPYDLSNEAERAALAENTRHLLSTLPADQRKSLGMAFFDGLNHVEIAEMTGETSSAIRLKIRETLLTLRREFLA